MYKCYHDKIVTGKESFPLSWIIGENLLYLAMWGIAGFLFWPICLLYDYPLLTILWAITVIVIQILLKKHNCGGCFYYGKSCHLGWGKLSALMFKQDSGDPEIGKKLSLFYILSPPLTIFASFVYTVYQRPSNFYWGALAAYIVLNIIAFLLREKGRKHCAMREACPGSAYRGKQGHTYD